MVKRQCLHARIIIVISIQLNNIICLVFESETFLSQMTQPQWSEKRHDRLGCFAVRCSSQHGLLLPRLAILPDL